MLYILPVLEIIIEEKNKYKGQNGVTGIEFALYLKSLRNQKCVGNDRFQVLER